jgi:hypothetical protein
MVHISSEVFLEVFRTMSVDEFFSYYGGFSGNVGS